MELEQRWCDNAACRDYGKVGAGNIKAFSHVERRYYCTTCRRTFSADKHTFFETLRCPRATILEARVRSQKAVIGAERWVTMCVPSEAEPPT